MKLNEKLSVCVVTHIVDADTNPYIENKMIEDTILSSHKKLNLGDVKYYVYIDSKFKTSHNDLYKKYEKYLMDLFEGDKFKNINVEIVSDSKQSQRDNYIDCVTRCNTPYMLFLEHDWEFVMDIPTEKILSTLDSAEYIKYLRFNRFTDKNYFWDKMFETVYDLDIPVTKITYFSGNPHIIRTCTFIDEYLPTLYQYYPEPNSAAFERDFFPIINDYIQEFGVEKTNLYWGTYCYEHLTESNTSNLHIKHLGDWCRKK